MAVYETRAQYEAQRSRRVLGLSATVVLLALGVYFIVVYIREGSLAYGYAGSLPLAFAFLAFALSIFPLSIGIGRREHPVRIEMTPEVFRMVYSGGRKDERPWNRAPIDTAHDLRKATSRRKPPRGLEVIAWVPIVGVDPQVEAFRPQQLTLSAEAFDEARRRMATAGCTESSSPLREGKKGTLWRFAPPAATGGQIPKG